MTELAMTEHGLISSAYIFLSYASADREEALRIADLFEVHGIPVWIDRKSIAGGTSWGAEIVSGIEGCAALAVLCSPAAMASPNVQQEIQLAWEGRRPILPLLLEPAQIPGAMHYAPAGRQWVEVLQRADQTWMPETVRALAALGVRPTLVPGGLVKTLADGGSFKVEPLVLHRPTSPHNLPLQLTSFVGRERELAEVRNRLTGEPLPTRLLRLAVFAGGFTLEAAEAICGDELVGHSPPDTFPDVLDLLLRLVEKSLVIAEETNDGADRYRLLETLRQYAQEKLVARGEAEARLGRHATYFAGQQAEVAPGAFDTGDLSHVRWLEREFDNLRAALHWRREREDTANALRLATLLESFWLFHGYLTKGRKCLRDILALPGASVPTSARAGALVVLAGLARRQTDYAAARAHFDEALALYRQLGESGGAANMLFHLANVSFLEADFPRARAYLHQARALAEGANDPNLVPTTGVDLDYLLGQIALHEGNYAAARQQLEAGLRLERQWGETLWIAYCTHSLGCVALGERDLAAARAYFAQTIAVATTFGEVVILAHALDGTSGLAVARGEFPRAVRLAAAATAERRHVGAPNGPAWSALFERWFSPARQALSADAFATAWREGEAMTLEQAIAYALEEVEAGG